MVARFLNGFMLSLGIRTVSRFNEGEKAFFTVNIFCCNGLDFQKDWSEITGETAKSNAVKGTHSTLQD